MTRYQPRSLAPLSMTTNHTMRPVIDELRDAQQPPDLAYDPAVDAAARGLLSASCLSGAQLEALQARLASEHQPIADRAAWSEPVAPIWAPGGIPDLPIGMIEPPEPPPAPSRSSLTPWVFWALAALALGLIVARAEGWL